MGMRFETGSLQLKTVDSARSPEGVKAGNWLWSVGGERVTSVSDAEILLKNGSKMRFQVSDCLSLWSCDAR